MKSKDLLPAVFSRYALAYQQRLEQFMESDAARGRHRVIELIAAKPGMRVLDLACGPGTLTRRLATQVAPDGEVVGVDLAPGMIELARAGATANARFEVMDIEQLAFGNASFDAAACGHGIQFAPHLATVLLEVRRVLGPGSRFAASVPVEGATDPVWSDLDAVVVRWLGPPPMASDQDLTREVVGDMNRFEQAVLDAGFSTAGVEVIEEKAHWASAEQLVSMVTSWWDCAARLESVDTDRRQSFAADAVATLRRAHPGTIETTGRNHVLFATV